MSATPEDTTTGADAAARRRRRSIVGALALVLPILIGLLISWAHWYGPRQAVDAYLDAVERKDIAALAQATHEGEGRLADLTAADREVLENPEILGGVDSLVRHAWVKDIERADRRTAVAGVRVVLTNGRASYVELPLVRKEGGVPILPRWTVDVDAFGMQDLHLPVGTQEVSINGHQVSRSDLGSDRAARLPVIPGAYTLEIVADEDLVDPLRSTVEIPLDRPRTEPLDVRAQLTDAGADEVEAQALEQIRTCIDTASDSDACDWMPAMSGDEELELLAIGPMELYPFGQTGQGIAIRSVTFLETSPSWDGSDRAEVEEATWKGRMVLDGQGRPSVRSGDS